MASEGDVVHVDSSAFVASPVRTGILRECIVLEDSNASQTYLTKTDGTGTPMYVWNNLISVNNKKGDK
jgi:hypothetical protein